VVEDLEEDGMTLMNVDQYEQVSMSSVRRDSHRMFVVCTIIFFYIQSPHFPRIQPRRHDNLYPLTVRDLTVSGWDLHSLKCKTELRNA
jgi:hypothetical protein